MQTDAASGDHRGKVLYWSRAGDPAAFDIVRRPDTATREAEARVSPRVSLLLIVGSSVGLWGLIWFALTSLISKWP
jgi:hypothetical protein